ncbi:hypothetical protein [Bacteroides sedimenti]|uniref:Lipoprotein n=1 Tax=Bacteroides sedimenti TaxID=2136147 RepID=A0ABM8IHC3_9BACE
MNTKKRNIIYIICIGIIFIIGLFVCKNESKQNGFVLQKFNVVNRQLYSIINSIKDSAYISKASDNVIVLELRINEFAPEFCFTSTKKEILNKYFIFGSNLRIVGYIEDRQRQAEIIVLSRIDNRVDFEMAFYKFLTPTNEKKYFNYIYFPDDQYVVKDNGEGYPPPFFDPYFYYYIYKGNNIIPAAYGKNKK